MLERLNIGPTEFSIGPMFGRGAFHYFANNDSKNAAWVKNISHCDITRYVPLPSGSKLLNILVALSDSVSSFTSCWDLEKRTKKQETNYKYDRL